jgi:hypothetical protein
MREYLDTRWRQFDSPMARFMFERVLLEGDFGEDEYSDEQGTWGNRYGRRVLEGDDRGFVYYVCFPTSEEATAEFRKVAEQFETEDEDR